MVEKKTINSISYNTNQKSVGDTILINWDKLGNVVRYELQYNINNEWIIINNNITDTEYVYTFEQPNPTAQFKVRGVNDLGETDWVVGETFEVTNQSFLNSSITINPYNKMRGYVDIIGYGESDLSSNLVIRQIHQEELDSVMAINMKDRNNILDSSLIVSQRDLSTFDSRITVNPSGRMRGYIDIVAPVKKVKKIYPIKDSVVRQSAPTINYGDSQQMLAGEDREGKFISYLGFDLEFPDDIDIESIKLVLNKQYDSSRRFLMGLYETSNDWDEYDITWGFRPYDEEYITQFPIPVEAGRVEVDISDFIWVDSKKSFIIRPRNYNLSELTAFGTKESLNPPYIEVIYYEIPTNANSMTLDSNITIRRKSNRDISASINVESDYYAEDLSGSLSIDEKQWEKYLESSIMVSQLRHAELDGGIVLEPKSQETKINSSIIVPYREFLESSIGIDRKNQGNSLNSSLNIREFAENNLDSKLDIENKYKANDLSSSIIVKRNNDEYLDSYLTIENKYTDQGIDSTITVGRVEVEELGSSINLEAKTQKIYIESSIILRRREDLDLNTFIEIPKYNKEADLNSSLYVLFQSNLESSIEIPKVDSKEEIGASLTISKYLQEDDINASMIVRQFWVDELDSFINVERNFEINADINLEKKNGVGELKSSIFVDVGGDYVFIM